MKPGNDQPNQPASANPRQFNTASIMNIKTAPYLRTFRRKLVTIMRLLPGLQTMQFGIGM
jgi:hypothetical protein